MWREGEQTMPPEFPGIAERMNSNMKIGACRTAELPLLLEPVPTAQSHRGSFFILHSCLWGPPGRFTPCRRHWQLHHGSVHDLLRAPFRWSHNLCVFFKWPASLFFT